ncbi:MAG: metalloregulator ArsR/SmtB family transcription factor [Chloroflexota bacterium]|nr:metalloregulator ArsR/SmtB family transcription factor [Chloroflexota bacterium]
MDNSLEQEAKLLHAHICEGLGDPKRVMILYLLADQSRNVTELTEALGVSQPTVSHHLKILRERGLVLTERDGTAIYYSLADPRIIQALDILREMLVDLLAQRTSLVGISS